MSSRKGRWICGVNPVREALRSSSAIDDIYIYKEKRGRSIEEIIKLARAMNVHLHFVDKSFFSSFPRGHQGIVGRRAEISPELTLADLYSISMKKNEPPFYLIIDGIEDPRNLGAIVRTAEVAGVHGLVMQKRRIATGMTVAKASAGAIEFLPIVKVSNIKHAIEDMQKEGIWIFGAETEGQKEYWSVDLTVPLAFVLGSEGKGIRRSVRDYCDQIVRIPVRGRVNSLNVSVAAGVLIYEALRQRMKK